MTGIVPAARAPGARRAAALPAPGQRGGCAHRVPGAWFSLWQPSWSPGQAWAVIPSSGLGAPSLTLRCQSAWRDVVAPAGDAQREVSGVRMLTQRPYQVSGRCRSLCKTLPPLTSLSSSESGWFLKPFCSCGPPWIAWGRPLHFLLIPLFSLFTSEQRLETQEKERLHYGLCDADEKTAVWKGLKNVTFMCVEDSFRSVYTHHVELILSQTYISSMVTGSAPVFPLTLSHSSMMGKYMPLNCSHCVYICIGFSFLIWLQFFSDFYLTGAIICFFISFLAMKKKGYPFLVFRFIIHSPIIKFSIRWYKLKVLK